MAVQCDGGGLLGVQSWGQLSHLGMTLKEGSVRGNVVFQVELIKGAPLNRQWPYVWCQHTGLDVRTICTDLSSDCERTKPNERGLAFTIWGGGGNVPAVLLAGDYAVHTQHSLHFTETSSGCWMKELLPGLIVQQNVSGSV